MTSKLDETDIDCLHLIDFESETNCEWPDCESKADWNLIAKCCNASVLLCTLHKEHECYVVLNTSFCKCAICGKFLKIKFNDINERFIIVRL